MKIGYRNNPLTSPLRKLNTKMGLLFTALPTGRKTCEIAKRVSLVAVAFFLYAVFIPLAIIGMGVGLCLKTKKVEGVVNLRFELGRVKDKILSTLADVEYLKQMRSAKVTIQIESGKKKWTEKCIIKKPRDASFMASYLSQELNPVIEKIRVGLKDRPTKKLSINWGILIKDPTDETYFAHGARRVYFQKGKYHVENEGRVQQNAGNENNGLEAVAVDG
jgi:hypothetical protein